MSTGTSNPEGRKTRENIAANRPITRNETKRTGVAVPPPSTGDDIRDATQGRFFLEERLLLCPTGEPTTNSSLIACLHQISNMKGATKPVASAVRAVAFLIGELEETAVNEIVRDAVTTQLNELTADVKLLVNDVKEKIDDHMKSFPPASNVNTADKSHHQPPRGPRTYANVLVSPPPHANPKLAAREGIRARQFMLEGLEGSPKVSQMSAPQLKAEFNRILERLGAKGKGVRSALPQKHKGVLFETEDDSLANWMKVEENRVAFCNAIGPEVVFKSRVYNLIAHNVAIAIDTENQRHREEICEVNHLKEDAIVAMRWIKPIQRRSAGQKTAHLILLFNDVDTANRSIANGLTVCSRRVRVEKIRKEPIRCLKCHGWNHYANECISTTDTCGNCAEKHRTNLCTQPQNKRCVSCNVQGHASWSRECPIFLKKVDECNQRNPENALQFIPSVEPWTWTANPEDQQYRPRTDAQRNEPNRNSNSHSHDKNRGATAYVEDWSAHPPYTWDVAEPGNWAHQHQQAPQATQTAPPSPTPINA